MLCLSRLLERQSLCVKIVPRKENIGFSDAFTIRANTSGTAQADVHERHQEGRLPVFVWIIFVRDGDGNAHADDFWPGRVTFWSEEKRNEPHTGGPASVSRVEMTPSSQSTIICCRRILIFRVISLESVEFTTC